MTLRESPELDSDDEFDQLVEINIKQLDDAPTPVETPNIGRTMPNLDVPKIEIKSHQEIPVNRSPVPEEEQYSVNKTLDQGVEVAGKIVSPRIASLVSEWNTVVAEEQATSRRQAEEQAAARRLVEPSKIAPNSGDVRGSLSPYKSSTTIGLSPNRIHGNEGGLLASSSPRPDRKPMEKSSSSLDQQTTNEESEDELSK